MGKNKANRTKGNTRPSSSEHSAQLLSLSGKTLSGFIGFEALEKDTPSYVPVTGQHSSDVADLSVDSDLRMVMRKMLKRDSVTRLKAVQEFGDLCAEKDKDTVKNVLPFWPRLFNKLALDYDRRIREATHHANGKLISNVKREIAPYLKNIMGVWLLGQNDLHAPAASAAQTTFTATFPKPKQAEALMYCKNEIFSYFKDNLHEQTVKSMSEPNSVSPEDAENKYNLVISATLQAMKLFLVIVSPNEISNVQEDYFRIIAENKFWKYAKNKEAQIRGAWYLLIGFLCHKKPDLFADMEKKLVAAVFGSLAENDPVVAPSVWESALHVVVNFPNCWQGISIHKVVLPQLWIMLNDGGRGSAHVIYPCILPFLSKFPREVICKDVFLTQYFNSLRQSLTLDSVKSSTMECDAVLTTFIECLLYISFNVLEGTKEGPALLEKVLSDHVIQLVELSFYDIKYGHLVTSKFYLLLGSLIQKLENKCLSESEEVSKTFAHILTVLWNNIYNCFNKLFDKKVGEGKLISISVAYFFHSIFSPLPMTKAEKGKVRFEDDSPSENTAQLPSEKLPSEEMYNKMPQTFKHMIKFIKVLCDKIDEGVYFGCLKILDEIFASTLNTMFLNDILKSYEETDGSCKKTTLMFFDEIVCKWVSNDKIDKLNIECITDIVFSICSCVSEDEALDMLNTCCKIKNPVFLELILSKSLGVYVHEPVIKNWLKSPVLVECILAGMQEMMEFLIKEDTVKENTNVSAQKNMLLTCLINKNLLETLERNQSIEKILLISKDSIEKSLECKNMGYIIDMSCNIIEKILLHCKICWEYSVTDDLLSHLFSWNLNSEKYGLSEKCCKAISDVWCTAVYTSCKSCNQVIKPNSFILRAARELNSSLTSLISPKQASKTLNEILKVLHSVEEVQASLPDSYTSSFILSELLENILPSESDWDKLKGNLSFSLIPSFTDRKIFYPWPSEKFFTVSHKLIDKLYLMTKVISQVFTQEIERHNDYEEEQYYDQYTRKNLPNILWCFSYCSGNGYLNEESKLDVEILDENCMGILQHFSQEKIEELLKDLYKRSLENGIDWALTFKLLLDATEKLHPVYISLFSEFISEASVMESDNASLVVQILSHHVSKEKKLFYLKKLLKGLTDTDTNKVTTNDLRKLAEICCFVQNPGFLDDEVLSLLLVFFNTYLMCDCTKDLKSLFSLQMTSLISFLIEYAPMIATDEIWDYYQLQLTSMIESGMILKYKDTQDLLLLFQISTMYTHSFSFTRTCQEMKSPWIPCVSNELNSDFISLFIHIGGTMKKCKSLSQAFNNTLASLLKTAEYISADVLFEFIMKSSLPTEKSNALDSLSSIILSDIQHLQLASHLMLVRVMPLLAKALSNIPKSESDDEEDEEEKIPSKLLPIVDNIYLLNELMENMLGDFKIGECCLVLPSTAEPYSFASAYLFSWLQMLEFISCSPSQVRSGYIAHLEETKLLSSLFSNLCRLMPENPMTCFKKELSPDSPKKESLVSLFLQPSEISAGNPSPEDIQMIACYVFCSAMRKVPATVRTWWNNLDKKSADIVNRFTSKYISGLLCAEEIHSVQNNENLFKNMVVKARLGSREVVATYTVDDYTIELSVQLPPNYPLGPIQAEKRAKIVIQTQEWRHWMMQLTTVLNYQNGSILDGLSIWKKNLDKKFEGVEECMICYYILHSSTLKLPKLSCHVCKKKFHSACLYKWFHSSNNFTCPLCRNEFVI